MALTQTQANMVLGPRSNTKQMVFGIPAGPIADTPGILCLESVSDAVVYARVYLWADDTNNLRYSTTLPTDENGSGSVLATTAATGANYTLSNLGTVAANTSILSDTDSTDSLGSSSVYWANTYTDVLYLTSAFHVTATTGTATVTGSITLDDGDFVITEGKITVTSVTDEQIVLTRNQATTTGPWVKIYSQATSDDYPGLHVDFNGTGAIDAMQITTDAAGGAGLRITTANVAGNGLAVVGPASTTASLAVIDGKTGSWLGATGVGMLHLKADGTLAHAAASLLNITHDGAVAANALGSSLRIVDTATASGTSYAAHMTSSTNNVLYLLTTTATTTTPLTVKGTTAATVGLVNIDCTDWVGASAVGAVNITGDGVLLAGANLLHVASTAANGAATYLVEIDASGAYVGSTLGTCLRLVDSGAAAGTSFAEHIASTANGCLSITGSAVAKNDILITGVASKTAAVLKLATASLNATDVGTIHLANSGNLAHANATNLYITQSGTVAANSLGCVARFVDASAASATSYAVQVTSAANGCLRLTGAATAYPALYVSGATSATASTVSIVTTSVNATGVGTLSIINTGTLAHANATNLYVSQGTGTIANATLGACARFIDTTASATTSAAVQITSTNNRSLVCTVGQADFISGMSTKVSTAACAGATPTEAELITAFGAANTHTTGFVGILDTGNTKCFVVFTNATSYFFSAAMTVAT